MNNFFTLFKYELKKQFPKPFKKGKMDVVGFLLSFILTIAIIGMSVYFLTIISKNYVVVKLGKVFDSSARAYELLNIFYMLALTVMSFVCLENMRKTLTDTTDKKILLRLPVKEQTIFLGKLAVLLIKNYFIAFLLIIPINIIIFVSITTPNLFWLMTIIVWLAVPIFVFLISSIFIVPYIKLIDFVKNRYILLFSLLTILLVILFVAYMLILSVVKGYLESGFIKFIFNENFILTLQTILTFSYPSNCLAGIVLGKDLLKSFLVICLGVVVAGLVVYFVTKKLYHITLYKDDAKNFVFKKSSGYKQLSTISSLIKKEFVCVAREPKHIFSYLVIATTMPVMVYCCYALFESLIFNMIGLKLTFPLALFVLLIFSVLTNTFCSTNLTRDGLNLLKQKTLPIKASTILFSKVLFCFIVSSLSVLISALALILLTSLSFWDGLLCIALGLIFSASQILVATRLDLKYAKIHLESQLVEKQTSKTVTKVVSLGLVFAFLSGLTSILLSMFSRGVLIGVDIVVKPFFVYLLPVVVGVCYLAFAILYYFHSMQKAFDKVSR